MTELLGVTYYWEGELDEKSNGQKMPVPRSDGPVDFCLPEIVPAVGYSVK